jgi:predicted PurR-regulated permease PerM
MDSYNLDNSLYQMSPKIEEFNMLTGIAPSLTNTTVGQALELPALVPMTPNTLTPPSDLTSDMDTTQEPLSPTTMGSTTSTPKYSNYPNVGTGIIATKASNAWTKVSNVIHGAVKNIESTIQTPTSTVTPQFVQFVAWMIFIILVVVVALLLLVGGKMLYKAVEKHRH